MKLQMHKAGTQNSYCYLYSNNVVVMIVRSNLKNRLATTVAVNVQES
jgi:hypothetical protein